MDGVRESSAPAATLFGNFSGTWGSTIISLLVMLSALGAVNGLIFTGSRIYASLGSDHSVFAPLGRWSPRFGSPVWSLLAQGAISLLLILAVGTDVGRGIIDSSLGAIGLSALPWAKYFGGFDTLIAGTAPVFWLFFLLTGLSVFALREKDPTIHRPFVVPLYPFVPFIFCVTCTYMLYRSILYAEGLVLLGVVPLALGIPLYLISRRTTPTLEPAPASA
jgi:amino acid transporter